MVLAKRLAVISAACILATACSSVHPVKTVEVATLMTYPNPVIEGKVLWRKSSDFLPLGQRSADFSTLFTIRNCNEGHTLCADAIVKPVISYAVRNLQDGEATISVNVSYDVGRRQIIETKGLRSSSSASLTIDPNVDVITGHSDVSKTALVKLGEIRKIQLPNGVRLEVCVALHGEGSLPQPNICDFSVVQTDSRIEGAVKPL